MRRICLILLLMLTLSPVLRVDAADKPKPPVPLQVDTAAVAKVRIYDTARLNAYRKQPEFQYSHINVKLSWWARFWHWFWNWLSDLFRFRKHPFTGVVLKYVLIALGLGAIIFIILKLAGIDMANIFSKKAASTGNVPYSESLENIHEIDFDAELEQAIAQHNYRLAVRLLYLKCLKQLNDDGLIHWQISKTNSNYISELNDETRRAGFSMLTRQFEYVWYGDLKIDAGVFERINLMFANFRKGAGA